MLVDASVARSFAVVGWSHHLIQVCSGTVLIADGVHGAGLEDPSELRRIRTALLRQPTKQGLVRGWQAVRSQPQRVSISFWPSVQTSSVC